MTAKPTISIIPNLPLEDIGIIQKDASGNMRVRLHPSWHIALTQLFTGLQTFVSSEGHLLPSLNTEQISGLNTTDNIGKMIFDTDSGFARLNNDGTFKQIVTS